MNRQDYRAQVDAVSFSPDFQARTMARLTELAEEKTTKKVHWNTGLVAVTVAVVLLVSACAATVLLRPQDVAHRVAGHEALAAAFEDERTIIVNETKTVGDYEVTLMGMVSGENLTELEWHLPDDAARDRTFAVLAFVRADGTPIEKGDYKDWPQFLVNPLVEGYAPWLLNSSALNAVGAMFIHEGVYYYLFECDNLEIFADHTVYLEVCPEPYRPPIWALADFDEATGAFTPRWEDVVLFTLPLDEAKADPEQAQAIVDSRGPLGQMQFPRWEDPDWADSPTASYDRTSRGNKRK